MAVVETLEQRRMLSAPAPLAPSAVDAPAVAGPRLTGLRVLGGPLGATGIRLMFDGPLDPDRARREANYVLRGDFTSRDLRGTPNDLIEDGGDFFDDNEDRARGRFDEVPVEQANYDDATAGVTLRVHTPFLLSHLRTIYVRSGPDGLRDPTGNSLDGDGDGQAGGIGIFRLRTTRGTNLRYFDADGDRVRLRLRGPGRLFVFRQIASGGEVPRKGDAVQVWLAEPSSPQTVLSGTVAPSKRGGDGRTFIGEILSVEEAQLDLLGNPSFQVGAVVP